jgi:hypothetical protein
VCGSSGRAPFYECNLSTTKKKKKEYAKGKSDQDALPGENHLATLQFLQHPYISLSHNSQGQRIIPCMS